MSRSYRPSESDVARHMAKFAHQERQGAQGAMKAGRNNKYKAQKTTVDGLTFHSKREAERYKELKLMHQAGQIHFLITHPPFLIEVNGVPICKAIMDFRYTDKDGRDVVEDVKSKPTDTPLSRLKRKLVKAIYGIDVVLVR